MAGNNYKSGFRERIIIDYKKGVKQKEIATKYSINKSIVDRIIKRFNEGSPLETEYKGGRPRKTYRFTDRKVIRQAKKNPFDSTNDTILQLELSVSENIVCIRLQLSGLLSFRAAKKPLISPKNKKARIEFPNWTINDWKRVLWGDESK